MNKKIKYNDVMENLTMTPEMENRILENLKKATTETDTEKPEIQSANSETYTQTVNGKINSADDKIHPATKINDFKAHKISSEDKNSKSNTVRFRRRWIASLSAAAAAFVVIIGSVTANNLTSRIAPNPSSETATNDSTANDASNDDTALSSTGGFSSSINDSEAQGSSNNSTDVGSETGSDTTDNGSNGSSSGTQSGDNGSNESGSETGSDTSANGSNNTGSNGSSSNTSSGSSKTGSNNSGSKNSNTSNNSGSKTNNGSNSNSSKNGNSSTQNGSNASKSGNNASKSNNDSGNKGSKDNDNSDTVVSGNNGSETDTDMSSLSALEKAAGFEITEPALPFDVGDTNYLMLHDGIAEIDYTSKDQASSLYFDQSDDENAIDSRFSDQFSGYDTVEEFSVNTAKITAYGSNDGYMMTKVTNGSRHYVLTATAPYSLDKWKNITAPICN